MKINLEIFLSPGALSLYNKSSAPTCDQQHNLKQHLFLTAYEKMQSIATPKMQLYRNQ